MISCDLMKTIQNYLNKFDLSNDYSEVEEHIKTSLDRVPFNEILKIVRNMNIINGWSDKTIYLIFKNWIDNKIKDICIYINISYISGEKWFEKHPVFCQISFSDTFNLLYLNDNVISLIPIKHPFNTYSIGNSSFTDENEEKIIKTLLEDEAEAIVSYFPPPRINDNIEIALVGIKNKKLDKLIYTFEHENNINVNNYLYACEMIQFVDDEIKIFKSIYNEFPY